MTKRAEVKKQNDVLKRKDVVIQKTIELKERMMTITEHLRLRLLARANLVTDGPYRA